jgi:hypothetical protein
MRRGAASGAGHSAQHPLFRGRARASSVQGWLLGKAAHNRCLETNPWGAGMGKRSRGRRDLPFYIAAATLALAAAARAQANLSPTVPIGPQPAEIKIVSSEFKYSPARVLVAARTCRDDHPRQQRG